MAIPLRMYQRGSRSPPGAAGATVAALAFMVSVGCGAPAFVRRSATNDVPSMPLVSLMVTAATETACHAYEEFLPALVLPTDITGGGVWLPDRRTIRWGPFIRTSSVEGTYRLTGPPSTYRLDGRLSADGSWAFTPIATEVAIVASIDTNYPVRPATVAPVVIDPPGGTSLPVTVTMACVTSNAHIRYTTDGTAPTTNAALYIGPFQVATDAWLRAQAFAPDALPSVVRSAWFMAAAPRASLSATRGVTTNNPWLPEISIVATQMMSGTCWTYEEALPMGLIASNITENGAFNATNRVIKWGPFIGGAGVTLAYQAAGPAGTYSMRGRYSIDGISTDESSSFTLALGPPGGGNEYPARPGTVAPVIITPADGGSLPATVTMTCATTNAEIRYTTDGTAPNANSMLYTGAVEVSAATWIRAQAFASNAFPGAIRGEYLAQATPIPTLQVGNQLLTNTPTQPVIEISVTQTMATAWAYELSLPPGLMASNVTQNGVYNPTNSVVRWGPFVDRTNAMLACTFSGQPGTYPLRDRRSVDGHGVDGASVTVTIPTGSGDTTIPTPPSRVDRPVVDFSNNGQLPTTVTISCGTTDADLRYTLDGTSPTLISPHYSGSLLLSSNTVLRVRAFKDGFEASSAVYGVFPLTALLAVPQVTRTITDNGTTSPSVELLAIPPAGVKCFTVSETIPGRLTPYPISHNGTYNTTDGVVRWGPFFGADPIRLTYQLRGKPGLHRLAGAGSADGLNNATTGPDMVQMAGLDMGAYETPYTLNLQAFLQGPYRTNTHAMVAGNRAVIPLTSPYLADPRAVLEIPSNVVDWVLVELVDTNGATAVSKSAFLDTGGRLIAADGGIGITAEMSVGFYSVSLKHRNHLAAMSAVPVAFTNYSLTYDFTTDASQYAGGANAAVELEPNIWGLIAGDADGDGAILGADAGIYSNQVGRTGYRRADLNLDGTVDGEDLTLLTANGGRQSGAARGGTPLSSALTITPQRKTVLAGSSFTLTALGTRNVNWDFVVNASGATLSPSNAVSAVYTAGSASNCVDIVQAQDGDRLGRAWVNVISSNEVARIGKAIVIAGGKGPSDPLAEVTDYLGDLAYNALLYRGYAKENVQYLNPVTEQDVDGNGTFDDVAATATLASAASTFTNWAMTAADRLFVYLVDHGGTESSGHGYFQLNEHERLTAAQLGAWLDQIQDAHGKEMVVVLDFCQAGSFLGPLQRTGRTVIASCAADEPTYFLAGGLVSFSDTFFGAVVSGQDLAGAFRMARNAMALGDYQDAWLDADGDGAYDQDDLTSETVVGVYIGPSFISGRDVPQIGHVMGGHMLQGAAAATLWAYDITSSYTIYRVWCVVVPPGHSADPDDPVADLPILELSYRPDTGRYEAEYNGFIETGSYTLMYYAQDIRGGVSLPRLRFVQQTGYDERMVLVAGGSTNDPGWVATANLAAWAYQTARARRLGKSAVRYLSAGPPQDLDGDGTNDVTAAATLSNLAEAITLWPTNAHRLTVYLLGSSTTNGQCRLNGAETLPAAQLDGWLDNFQASNTAALVVMDFDGCGGYVPLLIPPSDRERIVIASTAAHANRVCAVDGLMSFSKFFLSGVLNGKSIGEAFYAARSAVRYASGVARQRAQMDDSGNGIPDQKNIDGRLAEQRFLGTAFTTGADAPFVASVIPDQRVTNGAAVLLWARVLSDEVISNVWCVITPPDYGGTGGQPQANLAWNAAAGRYEAPYSNLTLSGTHACTFYALDNEGQLAAPVQSLITVGGNPDAYEVDDAPAQAAGFAIGETQRHNFDIPGDEDWTVFYAPTGFVFKADATQMGTNSDIVLELYREQPGGDLALVDWSDDFGTGSNRMETVTLNLATVSPDQEPGVYYVRVSSYDPDLFGPDSEYDLRIWNSVGGGGGVIHFIPTPPGGISQPRYGDFYVSLGPPDALAAGAAWKLTDFEGAEWHSDAAVLHQVRIPDYGYWHIAFKAVAGFSTPQAQELRLDAKGVITVPGSYTYTNPYTNLVPQALGVSMSADGVFEMSYLGCSGKYYAIEESTNLLDWIPIGTNQIHQDGMLWFSATNCPGTPRAFYRWRLIQ